MDDIVLVGGGGHALSMADAIVRMGLFNIVGYTDIKKTQKTFKYLGQDSELSNLFNVGIKKAAVCIGYLGRSNVRDKIYNDLKQLGYELPMINDPSTAISSTAKIGEGTFLGKCAVVNADSIIGKMCIINSGAIVEHNNQIGDFTHIAVGATICGDVTIGDHTLIGANATILQGIKIGMNSMIGAGSIVLADVPDNTRLIGIWK